MYDDSVLKYNLCVQYITVYLYLWTVQNEPHSPEKPNTVYFEKCQLIWSFFVYNSCSPPSIICRCLYILCTTAVQSAQILVYFVWCVIIFLSVEKHLLGLDLCVCVYVHSLYIPEKMGPICHNSIPSHLLFFMVDERKCRIFFTMIWIGILYFIVTCP